MNNAPLGSWLTGTGANADLDLGQCPPGEPEGEPLVIGLPDTKGTKVRFSALGIISRFFKRWLSPMGRNRLEQMMIARTRDLEEANLRLQEKEEALLRQYEQLKIKEELLIAHNEELTAQEEELTDYVSRIAEQQQRDRVVKWIVTSIRESLQLDEVLSTTTHEVGRLLKVDRCFMTSYNARLLSFQVLPNEYRVLPPCPEVPDNFDGNTLVNLSMRMKRLILDDKEMIIVQHLEEFPLESALREICAKQGLKSLVVVPIIHKNELLGTLNVESYRYRRNWSEQELEVLRDIGCQVSIAIRQASLYAQAQEATRLKSEFLANMSHEFRTPLNAIIGFSEMLESENYGALTEKQRHYLQNVIKSGHHLLALVNDILDLSKVESGNMELHYELFDLPAALGEVLSILRGMAHKKRINLDLELDGGLSQSFADPARFKQILYNLLSNAIKFTEEGGQVRLKAEREEDGKTLVISVQDTGIGIREADRDKVFSEFRQIDASYARRQEGTGLGLALTKKLVEMHGGAIDFKSQPGVGSTFIARIPCLISEDLTQPPSREELEVREVPSTPGSEGLEPTRKPYLLKTPASFLLMSSSRNKGDAIVALLKHHCPRGTYREATSRRALLALSQAAPPDIMIVEAGVLEDPENATLPQQIKERAALSDIPLLVVSILPVSLYNSPVLTSLGVIDYLAQSLAGSLLPRYFERIRHHLVKEDTVRVLNIGNGMLSKLLQANGSLVRQQPGAYEFYWVSKGSGPVSALVAQNQLPDVVVIEMAQPLEAAGLEIIRQLKSRVETKYIPILAVLENDEGASGTPWRMEREPVPFAFSEGDSGLVAGKDLLRDVEYALRIKKGG